STMTTLARSFGMGRGCHRRSASRPSRLATIGAGRAPGRRARVLQETSVEQRTRLLRTGAVRRSRGGARPRAAHLRDEYVLATRGAPAFRRRRVVPGAGACPLSVCAHPDDLVRARRVQAELRIRRRAGPLRDHAHEARSFRVLLPGTVPAAAREPFRTPG